jgi:cytochrome c-type biogenesis protein CcmF
VPWLLATAYVHSVMIQERRGMMKVWNVSLLSGTFFFTIFGTFLTRSGLIASVHSFARSDIGVYFVWFMVGLALFSITLIAWRLPELRGKRLELDDFFEGHRASGLRPIGIVAVLLAPLFVYAKLVEIVRSRVAPDELVRRPAPRIESLLSREFTFLLNNWILTGMLLFILIATTFPLLSEWLRGETVTVGPGYYNKWMVPLGLILLFLMGVGPAIAWRKATGKNLVQAFTLPAAFAVVVFVMHWIVGGAIGFPARVESEEIYETTTGAVLAAIYALGPVACTTLGAFVIGTVTQEFARGTAMRMRNAKESAPIALGRLVARARRRYGGYIVHLGIVLAYLGFCGAAYDQEREASLHPGQTMEVGGYTFRYEGAREEVDLNKEMLFADVTVLRDGEEIAVVHPAKFVYVTHPEMPTTEVAIRSTPLNDLYVILSSVDRDSERATFRVIVRPFVFWIWFGGSLLLFGVFVAAFPTLREILGEVEDDERGRARGAMVAAAMLLAGALGTWALLPQPARAQSDSSSSLHAGTVEIHDPQERQLFERLLCECGDCQRLPLSTCGCSFAENMRAEVRSQMASGMSVVQIQDDYRERFGPQAIAIPSDRGLDRALWAVPVAALAIALVGLFVVGRRWARRGGETVAEPAPGDAVVGREYDEKLEDELRRFEEP